MSRARATLSKGLMPEDNNKVANDLRAKGEEILQKLKESIKRTKALLNEDYREKPNNNKPKEGLGNKTETLNIYHCNVRSIGNKKKSVDEIIRANNIDICFLSELNNKCVPLFKGYHQFTRY